MKRLKTKHYQLAAAVLFVVVSLPLIAFYFCKTTAASYFYCLFREDSWIAATNRAELEGRLWAPATVTNIMPAQSSWGSLHILADGQEMVRYMVFDREPLDVVYNNDGSIDQIFTSYE